MLEQILDTSRSMLALAEQGEWEQVEALQRQRQQLIERTFPFDNNAAQASQATSLLKQILVLDRNVRNLAENRYKAISRDLGRINQGRTATKAYQNASRD